MSASIYDDKLIIPTDKMLEVDLLKTKNYFDEITAFIKSDYGQVRPEWKFYNIKSGWLLKLFNKKRNVLFVVPCIGYFRVAFVFGGKASKLIQDSSKITETIKNDLAKAKKYMEGKIIEIEVKNSQDSQTILELIKIKMT